MLILSFFVFIRLASLVSLTLMDEIISIEKGDFIIHATLTDQETGFVWTIEERISSTDDHIEGKIDLRSLDFDLISIFYGFNSKYDNFKRLVISGNQCDPYRYSTAEWDRKLPGVTKPLTNLILLMGPSFLYRLNEPDWVELEEEVVRGEPMSSIRATLERKLNLTLNYRGALGVKVGARQPSRIVLTGYSPEGFVTSPRENLILDIYLQSQTFQQLAPLVQPTIGIGCPAYLQKPLDLPIFEWDRVHFLVREFDQIYKNSVIEEFHVDQAKQILRVETLEYGFTYQRIFDYNLGIEYAPSKIGSCKVFPMKLTTIGVSPSGSLSMASLLWMTGLYQYLGEVYLEHKSGYLAKAWESVEYDATIHGVKYGKVVTTQFMASKIDGPFPDHSLVGAQRNGYNKDSKGNYVLAYSIHRDYYEFELDLPDSDYRTAFDLGDCFDESAQRSTLTLLLTCDQGLYSGCREMAQKLPITFRDSLEDTLINSYGLSPLRIVNIEPQFKEKETIKAEVTFIEAPSITEAISYDSVFMDCGKLSQSPYLLDSVREEDCLRRYSSGHRAESILVFCIAEKLCVRFDEDTDFNEYVSMKGRLAKKYDIPFNNLDRLSSEKPLKELQEHLLRGSDSVSLKVPYGTGDQQIEYKIVDVIEDEKQAEEENGKLFKVFISDHKLASGESVTQAPSSVSKFSDCYRACVRSEKIFCEAFSFCQVTGECLVSSSRFVGTDNLTEAKNCNVYSKNAISDYREMRNQVYKSPTSVPRRLWIENCADGCAASDECSSFQFCREEGSCTFGGLYTKSSVQFSSECSIYTPKTSKRFELTGSRIVSQVLHTEANMDLDQCATLCFVYGDEPGLSCKSFNYCPRSASLPATCYLAAHTPADAFGQTEQSSTCHNYQLTTKSGDRNSVAFTHEIKHPRLTGFGAFGLTSLFLIIGLIVGFVSPYLYIKAILRRSQQGNTQSWTRQVDDE